MTRSPLRLVHPDTRRPLHPDTPRSLSDGTDRFPVVVGIPFLRRDRDALRVAILEALDADDEISALVMLLRDQDAWSPTLPPDEAVLRAMLAGRPTFRAAMAALNLGPVEHYFAHRWSAPTYLSALALLAAYAPLDRPLVDVACGAGQVLAEVVRRGGITVGVDQVFAKLWLGRRFLGLDHLVCADAEALPLADEVGPRTVLCHDMLYFLPDAAKAVVLAQLRRVAGTDGAVLLGHLHLRDHPHGGSRAHPLDEAGWRALAADSFVHDDAALSAWFTSGGAGALALGGGRVVAAISLASGAPLEKPVPYWRPVGPTVANPLLAPAGCGLSPMWPTADIAAEYADATYLHVPDAVADRARPEAERFARRTLIQLPEAW